MAGNSDCLAGTLGAMRATHGIWSSSNRKGAYKGDVKRLDGIGESVEHGMATDQKQIYQKVKLQLF